MKSFYSWYRKHITGAIFTGLILGILTGLFLAGRFEPVLTVTSLIGSIYMNALNMMIFPMVFCSIVIGICSIGNARTTGKITAASMIYFLCTTALASLCGLIIPRLIHLGKGVKFEMATADIQATEMSSILDTLKNLIPSNPIAAFADGNMLQVLVFALIIGFTLIAVGEKGTPFLNLIDSINEVCLKIITTIMYFTPIGVFCTIVPVVEANGTVCGILWLRYCSVRSLCKADRQTESAEIPESDPASSTECLRNLLKLRNHSIKQAVYGGRNGRIQPDHQHRHSSWCYR